MDYFGIIMHQEAKEREMEAQRSKVNGGR